jgi:formyltetrahydrofolate hydrolase
MPSTYGAVLARYMQVLSRDCLERVGMLAINIHHSFLPAFAGADPYRRAPEQGVKLIGATAQQLRLALEQLDHPRLGPLLGPALGGDVVERQVIRARLGLEVGVV